MSRGRYNFRFALVIVIFVIVLISAFSLGVLVGSLSDYSGGGKVLGRGDKPAFLLKDVDFDLYWQVWDIIKNKFFYKDRIVDTKLFYGSLAGMVAALDDPYSVFLDPQITEQFTEELSGSFEGIGAEIAIKKDRLTVIAPLPGSPAERAGLKAGDKILAIDGVDTLGMSLDQAVNLIRGEKGTEVKLLIQRNSDEPTEIAITRDKIDIVSVRWNKILDNSAYIQVSYFNEDTGDDFRQAIREILSQRPQALVVDLRNNPGGFLDVAVDMLGFWIGDDVAVKEKFSDGRVIPYNSNNKPVLKDIPTYILVNNGSASAAEIVAGALQDYGLATIVGEKTFGKGSVQDFIELDDGSAIKITVAQWLTPKGKTIEEVGIEPDVFVELTREDFDEDRDPQLDKVKELIQTNNGK